MAATTERAARLVASGAGMLAASVLADSAMEHYRGAFDQRAMSAPVAASAVSLMTSGALALGGQLGRTGSTTALSVHVAVGAVGAAGLGFHTYNISKQVGGLRWGALFYKAPIGAPGALVLAGVLGAAGQALSQGQAFLGPLPLRSGRWLAGIAAFGLVGTTAEAALLHFRGAYHNQAMYLPVTLPPVAALTLLRTALTGRATMFTTAALVATATMGLIGAGFHAFGISRNMGGFRNWRQNLLAGPPLPAPPSFTGLAIAGLGSLLLIRRFARG